MNDYDGKMIFGDLRGPKLPDICLAGEKKTRKTSSRELIPTGDRARARCVTGAKLPSAPQESIRHLLFYIINFSEKIEFFFSLMSIVS